MPLPISGGLIPPILSPLLPDDTVDQKSLHHLVEHIMTGGGTGIFVLGSTGEGALLSLGQRRTIIGVKDSYGDMARFQRLLRLCGQGDFAIFQGTQRVAGLSLLAGADGLVPGLANLAPSWFAEMIEAAGLHQVERVLDIQKRIVALWTLQSHSTHWLGCLKVAANLLGLCGTTVSAPLPKLSEGEVANVKGVLEQAGLM